MNLTNSEIGRRMKLALKMAKVTQRALSERLGVSDGAITSYIQGRTEASISALAAVAEMCNVTTDWLITGREPMHAPQEQPEPVYTKHDRRRKLTPEEIEENRQVRSESINEMLTELDKVSQPTLDMMTAVLMENWLRRRKEGG